MTRIERFAAYAAAFEKTYESDDFSHIEPFFTEDAVYEVVGGPPFEGRTAGREALFAGLRETLDQFDRRFATRELALLEGPTEQGDTVWFRWKATYSKPGIPPLVVDGEETLTFSGDRIAHMQDRFSAQAVEEANAYLAKHGAALMTG